MLTEALEYPRQSDDWLKTVLIGGVLTLFSWLLIPAFLLGGYLLRVLRTSIDGEASPPAFDRWSEMLVDGLKVAVIALAYSLLPALTIGVSAVLGGTLASGGDDAAVGLAGIVVLLGLLLSAALGLLVAYIIPAALANYAETDRLGAAFSWAALQPVLLSGTYATAWVTGFAIIFVAGLVSGVLNIIPLLGAVVGAFIGFYAVMAAYHVIGRAWADLHPVETTETEHPGKSPAV